MENYFKVNPIEKLYLDQKDEFENQMINLDTELKKAEVKESKIFEVLTNKLQELLNDKDFSEISKMFENYETIKSKYEDMMCFWYYKLGFNDSHKLNK